MIVAISRFRPPPEEAESLSESFSHRSRAVDAHPGFLGFEVLRSFEPSPEFLLVTRWKDRDSLKAYLLSEDFKAAKAAGAEQPDAVFSMYEVVAT